jgi:hypothetical protein
MVLAILVFLAPASHSSTVVPVSLARMVHIAGFVFGGTVSSIEYSSDRGSVIAHVHFRDLQLVKGAAQGKGLTLRSNISIGSQARFRVGGRYVILAVSDLGSARNSYIPIVGLYQGYFPVDSDSVVHNSHGWPVAEVRGGRIVLVAPHVEQQRPSVRIHDARDGEGRPIPDSILQPARTPPDRYSSPGSPEEVIRHEADPGTRVTEGEFLAILHGLDSQK